MVVALGDELREHSPVSRRELGRRPVGPVLDDQLALGVQAPAELDHVVDVVLILAGVPQEVRGRDGQHVVELAGRRQRERGDPRPVRGDEDLNARTRLFGPSLGVQARLASAEDQRLPVIRVHDVLALADIDQGVAISHQRVGRYVGRIAVRHVVGIRAGPVGIRGRLSIDGRRAWQRPRSGHRTPGGGEVSVLVRAVVTAGIDDRLSGDVADTGGGGRISRPAVVIGAARFVEAIASAQQHVVQPHAGLDERRRQRAVGVQVAQAAVRGKADGLRLVLVGALLGRSSPAPLGIRGANGDIVVGGPRVVHARMCDRQRARDDRRPVAQ